MWVHHPDNLSIKYHEQTLFCIKFAFSGQHETGISIEKCFKKSVFEVFNKNFSTESVKLQNQQFITCYSSLHFILLKMKNKKHLILEIRTTAITLL